MTRPRTAWWARRVAGGIPILVLVAGLAVMAGLSVVVVRANQEHQDFVQDYFLRQVDCSNTLRMMPVCCILHSSVVFFLSFLH